MKGWIGLALFAFVGTAAVHHFGWRDGMVLLAVLWLLMPYSPRRS